MAERKMKQNQMTQTTPQEVLTDPENAAIERFRSDLLDMGIKAVSVNWDDRFGCFRVIADFERGSVQATGTTRVEAMQNIVDAARMAKNAKLGGSSATTGVDELAQGAEPPLGSPGEEQSSPDGR